MANIRKICIRGYNVMSGRGMSGKKVRECNYDLMRVFSMMFVIMIHTKRDFIANPYTATILSLILFTCNGIFYMISGRFNLKKIFLNKEDYKKYYFSKIITILLPYIGVVAVSNTWSLCALNEFVGMKEWIKTIYIAFMNTNSTIHFWFLYPLIGMLISTPFLAKLFQGLADWELNAIFGIAIIWNFIKIYLVLDFNIGFSFDNWILEGWMLLYFAGYYCYRVINISNKKKVYIMGGAVVSLQY